MDIGGENKKECDISSKNYIFSALEKIEGEIIFKTYRWLGHRFFSLYLLDEIYSLINLVPKNDIRFTVLEEKAAKTTEKREYLLKCNGEKIAIVTLEYRKSLKNKKKAKIKISVKYL